VKSKRRVTTPTILQMEAVECGAASLAMVLAYHGRIVPLPELRAACGISRDGSKASNLVRAARDLGLVAKGYKQEPAGLRKLRPPMIIHWNFNHFVVFEGFSRRGAHINDPAHGPTIVSEQEFDQAFTGVVMTFEPGPDFQRGGRHPSFAGALRRRLKGASGAVALTVLAGLALVVPGLIAASFGKIFVDELMIRGMTTWVKPLLASMCAVAAIIFVVSALQQRYLLRLESRLSLHGSSRFMWHALRLPIGFFTQRYAGDITDRVAINDRVGQLLSGDLARTVVSLLVVSFYGVLLFQYDVVLAIIGTATAALNLLLLRYFARKRVHLSQRLTQDRGKMMGAAMGALQTVETLKATGSEADFFARWAGHQAKVAVAQQQLQLSTVVLSAAPRLLTSLNTAIVLGLGGARIMDGRLTIGMLVAFQAILAAFLAPVNEMVGLASTAQEVKGALARVEDVLDAAVDPGLNEGCTSSGPAAAKLSGALELRSVNFGYSRLDPPLIEGFDLKLEPGSRVALVGGSGSGKSTVAKLVAGLYEPWSGELLFDGRPRREIPRETLVQSIAVVDQDICLFEDSVRANIALWDPTLGDSDLTAATRDACLHDDIAARPGAYASSVEEGGRNFSGGQRQRMEIARALATDPTILVLDEATSALDPLVEKVVDDNLRRRGCTCLIVAHRLSTIRDCDEILVLDGGKVVQRGTHEQMVAMPGPYRTLISAET